MSDYADKPKPTNDTALAEKLCRRWQVMQADRMPFLSIWQEIADLMATRSGGINTKVEMPDTAKDSALFDTTAGDALLTMAGGLMSWTMPVNEPWFNFEPIRELRGSEKTRRWSMECSELAREYLGNSAYYTEAHEDLLSHCGFATSAMYFNIEEGKLRFEHLPTGSYCIEENAFGVVDTLFREFEWLVEKAEDYFGKENLSEATQKLCEGDKERQRKIKILHAVYRRSDSERPSDPLARRAGWGKSSPPTTSSQRKSISCARVASITSRSAWAATSNGRRSRAIRLTATGRALLRFLTRGKSISCKWSWIARQRSACGLR